MKKLLLFLMLLPLITSGQQFELGANYGTAFNATAAIKLFHHLKAGVGYEYVDHRYSDILGGGGREKMSIPFGYVEYYRAARKHQFYFGIDLGRMNITTIPDGETATESTYWGYGAHVGYSRKIITHLYGNVQIGVLHYQSMVETNSGGTSSTATTTGYFVPATIGIHYVIKPHGKKDEVIRPAE